MHAYRSHNCAALTESDVGQHVRLSGWIHRKRDHGQLVFIDLRDHYGLTQCVVDSSDASFSLVEATRLESVVTITGAVLRRSDDTINDSRQRQAWRCWCPVWRRGIQAGRRWATAHPQPAL